MIATDIEVLKAETAKVRDADSRIEAALARIRESMRSPEQELLERLVEQRLVYDQRKAALVTFVAAQNLDEGGVYLVKETLPVQTTCLAALNAFVQGQTQGMQTFGEQATRTATSARAVMIGLAAAALALLVVIAIGLTRSITRPIGQAVHMARTIASGGKQGRGFAVVADEVRSLAQ